MINLNLEKNIDIELEEEISKLENFDNITNALNIVKESKALTMANIDQELLSQISKSVEINRVMLSEDLKEDEELMQLIGSIITFVFIIPVFILVLTIIMVPIRIIGLMCCSDDTKWGTRNLGECANEEAIN